MVRDGARLRDRPAVSGAVASLLFANWETQSDGVYRLHFVPCLSTFPPLGVGTVFGQVTAPGYQTRTAFGTRREFITGLRWGDILLTPIR